MSMELKSCSYRHIILDGYVIWIANDPKIRGRLHAQAYAFKTTISTDTNYACLIQARVFRSVAAVKQQKKTNIWIERWWWWWKKKYSKHFSLWKNANGINIHWRSMSWTIYGTGFIEASGTTHHLKSTRNHRKKTTEDNGLSHAHISWWDLAR